MITPKLANLRSEKVAKSIIHNPVYIGLGTKYGNRFSQQYSRKKAIRLYEEKYRKDLDEPMFKDYALQSLKELDGVTMLCHCKPQPCHGDVLIKLFEEFILGKIKVDKEMN